MIIIKRLTEVTLTEALLAWNNGFENYFFDMTKKPKGFLDRFGLEGLNPEISIVAFDGNLPIGIVLNGIKEINNIKVSWNGGTGIASHYRGKGLGKLLMEKTIKIYEQEGVVSSTLEVLIENVKAVLLYKKFGYVPKIELRNFKYKKPLSRKIIINNQMKMVKSTPREVSLLSFYPTIIPWVSQWVNISGGEAIIALDQNKQVQGYAIFKKNYHNNGNLSGITLFQCVTNPSCNSKYDTTLSLVINVFCLDQDVIQRAVNVDIKDNHTMKVLKELGFIIESQHFLMTKSIDCN